MDVKIDAATEDVTERLQGAIDIISASGGGRLILGQGDHICGGIVLKSGVELHLDEGAVLRPVPDYERYAATRVESVAEDSDRAMVIAVNARGISVTGPGTIDGSGSAFIDGDLPDMGTWVPTRLRPRVLVLDRCQDVALSGFSIKNSPMWTIHALDCDRVSVRDVTVDNDRRMPNTDGIVVDACRDVVIEDCTFRTADDGIVLKTTARPNGSPAGTCRNVSIVGCTIESRSCAIKIGTETHGDVMDILADRCRIEKSNRGLGIFSRDGGKISRIRFSNITVDCSETPDGFWGSGEALTVTALDRKPKHKKAGPVSNLAVENLSGIMEGAINMVAERNGLIDAVSLRAVRLAQREGALGTGRSFDLRPGPADLSPSPDAAGRANAWVKGEDGKVVGLIPYPGGMPALYAENVAGLVIDDCLFSRPAVLPEGWNSDAVVTKNTTAEQGSEAGV